MTTDSKNKVLISLSELIKKNQSDIISKNQIDLGSVDDKDISMKDRLKVDEMKIEGMIKSLIEVSKQSNPTDKIIYEHTREDGLHIVNKTVPFGTILIIYESRPDVTIEAAATAFKAGNKILLKGGKESLNTNTYLTILWQTALAENGFEEDFVQYLDISREATQQLIQKNEKNIDLIIPRGGEALIRFVTQNSTVPVIVSGRGNNFIYIDNDSELDMATKLVINGKQRISVCNAIDKIIINKDINDINKVIDTLVTTLSNHHIQVYSDSKTALLNKDIIVDNNIDVLDEEFLATKMYLLIADSINQAIKIINQHSGGHSAVIVTNNSDKANQFMNQVDCAAVYHNASSRFTDGGQLGVGAEIAISTQKIHFRGPLGAQELVTNKWFVYGKGHTRNH